MRSVFEDVCCKYQQHPNNIKTPDSTSTNTWLIAETPAKSEKYWQIFANIRQHVGQLWPNWIKSEHIWTIFDRFSSKFGQLPLILSFPEQEVNMIVSLLIIGGANQTEVKYANFTGNFVYIRAKLVYTDGTVNSVMLNH